MPVTEFNDALKSTVNTMLTTMYEENGIGISAPQVSVVSLLLVLSHTSWRNYFIGASDRGTAASDRHQ